MLQGQVPVCKSSLVTLSISCVPTGTEKVLYAHAEFVKGRKWRRASSLSSHFALVFVISPLKRQFWQVVFIRIC